MAEQIAGSGEAFRAAASEMVGRTLKDGEFEEMMQKGLLKPGKLLPLVAKHLHRMATDSGALDKKLQQLEAVESRMRGTWGYFVRELYDKGVEAALKNLYKGIDRVTNSIKQLAGNAIGKFLKGALDMISFVALNLLDVFQIVIYLIDQAFGKSSDIKSTTAEILGWVVAFAAMAKIAAGIFRTMKAIAGISAMTGLSGASGKGIGGLVGKVMILGFASQALSALARAILQIKDDPLEGKNEQDKANITEMSGVKKIPAWIQAIDSYVFRGTGRDFALTAASRRYDKLDDLSTYGPKSALFTHIPPAQNVNVNITMDKNAKEFIKAEVQQNTQQQINSLIPPSTRSR